MTGPNVDALPLEITERYPELFEVQASGGVSQV